MENKAHALVAGAFVLVVTALLALLALWLTRDSTQRDFYEMSTSETISGLQPQAPVRFRGVPIGKVERIGFDEKVKGNVLVRVSIDRTAPLTRSAYATVASQGVTGLGFIQLDDEGGSNERLVPNDDDPPRIPIRPGGVDKLLKQSEVIFNQIEQASTKLNALLGDDTQKRVGIALDNVGQAANGVNQLATNMNTVLNAQLGPDRVNLPAFVKSANSAVISLQRTSQQAEASVVEIGNVARRLNEKGGAIDKLAEGGAALSTGAQTFSNATLPKVGEVADETGRTMRQLRRTVRTVDDNPQSLIYGNGPVAPGPGEEGFSAAGAQK